MRCLLANLAGGIPAPVWRRYEVDVQAQYTIESPTAHVLGQHTRPAVTALCNAMPCQASAIPLSVVRDREERHRSQQCLLARFDPSEFRKNRGCLHSLSSSFGSDVRCGPESLTYPSLENSVPQLLFYPSVSRGTDAEDKQDIGQRPPSGPAHSRPFGLE